MRIGVDCHVLSGKYQGSRTYIVNLYRAILRQAGSADFVFMGDQTGGEAFGPEAQYAVFPFPSRIHRLTVGTQALVNRLCLDAVHVGYIAPMRLKAVSIVTLYDVLFESHPQFFERRFVLRNRVLCRLSARRAGQIHTISDYSRQCISGHYGIPEDQIAVVPCGVDTAIFHPREKEAARAIAHREIGMARFILTVGRLEPRKNHLGLIRAYAELRQRVEACPPLIIVGQPDFRDRPIYNAIRDLRLTQHVHILSNIDDQLLPVLYRAAELFVYPSFAEGFGLPPLESMASGTPVITSNTTAIPEVVGDAAILVDPANVVSIADAMERVLSRDETAATLSERGPRQAMKWTWDAAAAKYLEAIEKLKANSRRQGRGNPSPPKTIAFCGTRGLPANYGGFETAVDHISRHFVDHGYTCQVFCRRSSTAKEQAGDCATGAGVHDGRQLVYVDGHPSRKLDTFVASIQTGRHLWRNRRHYDHVLWFNNANLPGILITALAGIPMSVNTDGLEWRRAKWSWPFKLYYWLSSFLIALVCRRLVSDSHGIQQYYRRTFFRKTSFIPYGAPAAHAVSEERAGEILRRYGLEAGKYFLQITRIEPDNLPLNVAEAFHDSEAARRGYRMVFVGYKDATPYAQRLISHDGRSGVRVHEAIYDPDVLQVLRSRCFCYVHGNSVGGTNPALLEAMATCPRVIAIDCIFSREVLGDHGRYFDPADIRPTLNDALNLPDESASMRTRVAERYNWEAVARSYMNLVEGRAAAYNPSPAVGHRPQVRDAIEATL